MKTKILEKTIIELINNADEIVSVNSLKSTRAIGDGLKDYILQNIHSIFPSDEINSIEVTTKKKSMYNIKLTDIYGNIHFINIISHNKLTHFNMPNITSIDRIKKLYQDKNNTFDILLISYIIEDYKILAQECKLLAIESFDWSCLRIGSLGCGQLQFKNSNNLLINENYDRKLWLKQMLTEAICYYEKEADKNIERGSLYKKIKKKLVS